MIFDEIVTAVKTTDLQNLLNPLNQTLLQNRVHANLEKILPNMNWRSPHKFTRECRDEVDIYGTFSSEDGEGAVIIELDKWRADQVAKKFVSRFALTLEQPLIYIALCFGGTESMNKNECEKYFSYCNRICNYFTQCNLRTPKQFYGHILR